MKKVGGKSKQSVNIDMVKEAVVSLGDRNGSTIKSILNYLMKTKNISASSRTLVILAIGRGVRSGVLAKKTPNTFGLDDGKMKSSPAKSRKRKTKRSRKTTAKSSTKRRRQRRTQRKRKSLKKRSRKASKKIRKVRRKRQTKRKARRSRPKTTKAIVKPVSAPMRRRQPIRKAARGKNYRVWNRNQLSWSEKKKQFETTNQLMLLGLKTWKGQPSSDSHCNEACLYS